MERPTGIKDKATLAYIDHLEKKLQVFEESPYVGSYLTLRGQIENWNQQLTLTNQKVTRIIGVNEKDGSPVTIEVNNGFIDLFSDKDSKEFDRAFKYFTEMSYLLKQLDETRKMMSPDHLKEIEGHNGKKLIGEASAEQHIFGAKK